MKKKKKKYKPSLHEFKGQPTLPRRDGLILFCRILLIVIGCLVYSNSLQGEFIFDDVPQIVDNGHIRNIFDWGAIFKNTRRPVLYLTFAANHALGGVNVWGYHAVNLLMHLLGANILFSILLRTFISSRLRPALPFPESLILSGGISLLWMVHPLSTQAVSFVVQRAESLASLFYLVTLYFFIRYVAAAQQRRWMAVGIISCALGMATKEIMATAPLMVLLYDRIFVTAGWREIWRRHGLFHVGLFLTWSLAVFLLLVMKPESVPTAGFNISRMTPWEYLLTQCQVVVHYLKLTFLGGPLLFDYYDWPIVKNILTVIPEFIFLAGLLGMTVWQVRKNSPLGFWAAWFFLILAPTSSFMPIKDVAFEYRMYLPLAGILAISLLGVYKILERWIIIHRWRPLILAGIILAIGIRFGYLTYARNIDYRSALSIWQDTVMKRPNNPRAHNNLGQTLFTQNRLEEAEKHYLEAVRLEPDYADALCNLGTLFSSQKKKEQAFLFLRKALAIDPKFAIAHNNLGALLADTGKFEEAVGHYQETLELGFKDAGVYCNLGIALAQIGKYDEAVINLEEALQLNPKFTIAQEELQNLKNFLTAHQRK